MAYRLTGSPFVLGLVAFFGHAPTSLIAPVAGVLVDRWDRHRVLLVTQVAAMLQSAALALFALTGWMTVEILLVLGAVQGVINGFDMPARQAFLRRMIDDPADLPNAIALNSSMVNLAKLLGPVIAAALVALVGEGGCFAIDAASYVAVIASLLAMRVAKTPPGPAPGRILAELADGLRYVAGAPLVRALLLLLAGSALLGSPYLSLLPVVAAEHLGGGPYTLGVLMGAGGTGALVAALFLANRADAVGLDALAGRSALVLGAALVALELASTVWLAAPILFVVGGALMIQMASTNTVVQTVVDPGKLGRVMSLYAVALAGGMPLGAFLQGALATRIGAVHTFAAAGVTCAAIAIVFLRARPRLVAG
jgi:MFS family permease